MKKTLTLLFAITFALCYAQAQHQITPIDPAISKTNKPISETVIECTDGSHYVYYPDLVDKPAKGTQGDVIISFDGDNATHATITIPKDFDVVESYSDGDNIITIYSLYDKGDKKYSLYTNVIDRKESEPGWNPLELASFSCEKRDNIYTEFAQSSDKSKAMLLFCQSEKNGELKNTNIFVLGEAGERLWENTFELDFSHRTFGILDATIDNEGHAYIAVGSYEGSNKKATNPTIHIYEVRESNTSNYSEPTTFGYINTGKMSFTKTGNILLAGYYSSNMKENEEGTYSLVFEPEQGNFASVNHLAFPANYEEEVVPKLIGYKYANQQFHVYANELLEFDNGTFALLGEQRRIDAVTTYNNGCTTTSYVYTTKNIMLNTISADGEISELTLLEKYQAVSKMSTFYTFRQYGLSYFPLMRNNEIFIIFVDNIDNYTGKKDMAYRGVANKHCSATYTIAENGNIERSLLVNSKTAKTQVLRPLFIEDNGLFVIDITKKAVSISKVNL